MNRQALGSAETGEIKDTSEPSAWQRLEEITAPVIVLAGDYELPHLRERMQTAATRLPGARLATLPRSAHLPQLDDAVHFAEIVAAFLERKDPAPPSPGAQ